MKISVHCLVKNEERFIWYAINSVIGHVDKIKIFDTGSDDNTCEIIKNIRSEKVVFNEFKNVKKEDLSKLRNEMLKEEDSDWIMILDGDEIWPRESLYECLDLIYKFKDQKNLIVTPVKMLIGDIYHFQEDGGGKYCIAAKKGHYNIRFIKNCQKLHVEGIYPNEAYCIETGQKIQDLPESKMLFSKNHYLHASYLARSSKKKGDTKYEIGIGFPADYYYPEVLFKTKSNNISSPWETSGGVYKIISYFETPLKKLKRRII